MDEDIDPPRRISRRWTPSAKRPSVQFLELLPVVKRYIDDMTDDDIRERWNDDDRRSVNSRRLDYETGAVLDLVQRAGFSIDDPDMPTLELIRAMFAYTGGKAGGNQHGAQAHARAILMNGWRSIIPVRGKRPDVPDWPSFGTAYPTPEQIGAWVVSHAECGIGYVMDGRIVAVDIDVCDDRFRASASPSRTPRAKRRPLWRRSSCLRSRCSAQSISRASACRRRSCCSTPLPTPSRPWPAGRSRSLARPAPNRS